MIKTGNKGTNREGLDKSRESKSTKEKIFDAAVELFSQRGFNAVSIRDITRRVGIKESSLYNHFNSKDEILTTIYEFFKAEAAKSLPPLERVREIVLSQTPVAFLEKGVELFVGGMLTPEMVKIWRILYAEQLSDERAAETVLKESLEKSLRFMERAFDIMIEEELVKPIDSKILSTEYIYPLNFMYLEYIISRTISRDSDMLYRHMTEHAHFFWDVIKIGG